MATKKKKKFVVSDELQQRIDDYHSMLDISPDPTVMYDPQGQVVYVNPAFTETFGWELDELFGSRLDFVPEEARGETATAVANLLKDGGSAIFTTRRLTKQGNLLDVQNRGRLLQDDEGQTVGSLIIIRDITLQKEMERALQTSEIRYREILETIKEGYYEVNLAGSFVFMNDQALNIFGYSQEKFMGLNFREYTSAEAADLIYKTFNGVFRTGEPIDGFTYPIFTEDGEDRFIEVSASLVKDEEDKPVGFRGIVRNVTERIDAEEKLRQSEERYRNILESIEDGYYETNLKGEFVFMNEQWAAFHAYPIAEMIGTDYRQYAVPEIVDDLFDQFNKVFKTGAPVKSIVNEVITKDGRRRHLDISASLIHDADGKPAGFRGVGRDVTDRILAEEQLRVSEERYRTILESIEEGYYEADLEGSFTFMNDRLCEVIGYPREELLGLNYREYTSPETAERVFATFNRVFKTGEPVKGFVWDAFGKDGRVRHLETYVLPRHNENGETIGFRGVGRDITQRVQAEEALAEALVDQERIASQLATVAKVSTAVSTILNPQEMLQAVVDQVKESFNLYHTHVYLLNQAGNTLELVAGAGDIGHKMVKEGRQIPLAQEQSLVARAARGRSGVIVNDVQKDPHFLPHPLLPNTRAEMAVPMIVGGQVLGVLDFQADTTDRFTQRYANIQTTLATQVAVALQNARLFAQAQRQTAELQETTNLLDQVVDILPIGLFMKDAQELRFVRWNKANEDIMGLKGGDVIGKNDYDFFPKTEADFFTKKDREVLAGEKIVVIPEETLTTPHRGERLLHTRKLPILGADGTPRYLLGVAEDITERKQAEELLQESLTMQQTLHEVGLELAQVESLEDLFAQAVAFCRDRLGFERAGIFTFDADNRRFAGTFGINIQGKLTDERGTAFITEDNFLAQFDDARQRVFTRHDADLYDNGEIIGKGWHLTVPLRQGDTLIGVLFSDALVSHRPLKPYEPDLLAAYGGTVANLMVRIRAESELQETNARAQAILESVTTPMLISTAAGGQILYANELLAELVEVPLTTLLEQGTPDFYVRQEDRTAVVGEIQATGAVNNYELELKRSGGEHFWAMLSARLFNFQNTPAILTTLIDITVRRQAQEAIRLSEQNLQESLRLQQTLHDVGLELAKAESLDELFRQAIVLAESHLEFQRIGLFKYDSVSKQFVGTYGRDLEGKLRDEKDIAFAFPEDDFETRFGNVRRRVIVEQDIPLQDVDTIIGHGWHLTVPIRRNEELIGALFAQEPLFARRPLQAYEPELLASFSAILTNLIERLENEQAVQESLRLQQTLHEVGLELSQTQTLDDLFRETIRLGHERLLLERFGIFVYNKDANTFLGTFGVDTNGVLRDEREGPFELSLPETVAMFRDMKQRLLIAENTPLWDAGEQVGEGWHLTVPIRLQNELYGVMFTDNLVTGRELPTYLPDLMAAFSSVVSNQLERNLAEQSVAAALSETERLYDMSARLNAAASIDDIMEAVVLPLIEQRLTAANLFTLEVDADGRPEWMEIAAAWASQDSLLASVDFPIGSRFYVPDLPAANQWIDSPQGMGLISDVDHDEGLDDVTRGIYQMTGIKAGANLALRLGERWVGLLALTWAETQEFTENDVRLYRSLAEQTAIILNNQLLFDQLQKRAAELATVAEVGAAITSIRNVNELLQRVVDLAKERFGLYHAHIYLLDEVEETLVLTSGAGDVGRQMVAEGRTIPLTQTQSLIARAVRTRQGVIVNDVTADKDFLPHTLLPDTKSEMAVPMIVGDEVLGVLDIQSNRVNRFSEEDVQIQTTLAAQIGVALQNAHSFVRSETALQELEEATRRLRREGWQSYLGTDGMNGLSYGYDQKEIKSLALAAPKSGKKRTKKADMPAVATLTRHLQVQGEPIGSLTLVDPSWAEDDADDIMTAVAERLSAHIENLRLSEQTEEARQQAERLFEGSTALNTAQNYDDVLAALRANSIMGHESVSNVSLNFFDIPWDADHTPVWIDVLTRWSRLPEESVSNRYALENFPSTEKLLRPDAPVIVEDVAKDKRLDKNLRDLYKNRFQAKSTIYVPLMIGSQWVGYINAIFAEKMQFPEDEIRRLTTLGQQAAVTIQSIRLFAQAQARAGELSVLNEMVSELTTMLEVEPILEAIYHYSTRLMDTTNFYIATHNTLTDEIAFPIAVEDNKRVPWRSRPFGNGMTEYLLQSGQPLFVEDGLEKWLKSQGVESIGSPSQSWMGVPLRVGSEVTGVIALQNLQPRSFTRSQFDLLNAVANQAAIAIQNARQFQQEQSRAQRQQMLREIAAKVRGSADVDAIMRTAVQEIGQALGRQTYVYLGADSDQPMDEGV